MIKQERAVHTRRALIRSAAELFEQCGYAQARLSEMSSGAGVSRGALHFHFENKAALAAAVEDDAAAYLCHATQHALRSDVNALQTLVDVSHVLAHLLRWDSVVRAGFQLNCTEDRQSDINLRQEWHGCVDRLLTDATTQGILAPDTPQQILTAAIVAATTGLEVLGRDNKEWLSPYSLTGFWQLLLPRLASPEALGSLDPGGTDSVTTKVAALPQRITPVPETRRNTPQ